jgi:hypothetical protein
MTLGDIVCTVDGKDKKIDMRKSDEGAILYLQKCGIIKKSLEFGNFGSLQGCGFNGNGGSGDLRGSGVGDDGFGCSEDGVLINTRSYTEGGRRSTGGSGCGGGIGGTDGKSRESEPLGKGIGKTSEDDLTLALMDEYSEAGIGESMNVCKNSVRQLFKEGNYENNNGNLGQNSGDIGMEISLKRKNRGDIAY